VGHPALHGPHAGMERASPGPPSLGPGVPRTGPRRGGPAEAGTAAGKQGDGGKEEKSKKFQKSDSQVWKWGPAANSVE